MSLLSNIFASSQLLQYLIPLLLSLLACYAVAVSIDFVVRRGRWLKALENVATLKNEHWFFGSILELAKFKGIYGPNGQINKAFQKVNAPLVKIHLFGRWMPWSSVIIFVSKAEAAQEILAQKNYRIMHKARPYRIAKPLIGDGLLSAEELDWKHQRKVIEPGFRYSFLKDHVVPIVQDLADKLTSIWDKVDPNEPVDMYAMMLRFTADAIGLLAFGYNFNGLSAQTSEDATMYEIFRVILNELSRRTKSIPLFDDIWDYLPTSKTRLFLEKSKQLNEVIEDVINTRKQKLALGTATAIEQEDILSQLLQKDADGNLVLTPKQILENCKTFLFAGHDTTASGLTWSLYYLAVNADVERKLYAEVIRTLNGREKVTFDDIEKMTYLNAFVKEVLRLHPSAGFMRVTTEPTDFFGTVFPPGVQFIFLPDIIHTDPQYYEDPLTFRPERWIGDEATKINESAYFPFSTGPRNCVGLRLAKSEMRVLLCKLVTEFRFRHRHHKNPHSIIDMTYVPVNMTMSIVRKTAADLKLITEFIEAGEPESWQDPVFPLAAETSAKPKSVLASVAPDMTPLTNQLDKVETRLHQVSLQLSVINDSINRTSVESKTVATIASKLDSVERLLHRMPPPTTTTITTATNPVTEQHSFDWKTIGVSVLVGAAFAVIGTMFTTKRRI